MPQRKHPSTQNIKVAVDNCLFSLCNGELHVLLIQMNKNPYEGMWALPGGLVGEKETLDGAAGRILQQQTSVKNVYLEQLYTFGAVKRDPFGRVVSTAYFALIPSDHLTLKAHPKYKAVRWQPYSKLPRLAYDHNEMVRRAYSRLRWKVEYTNIVWSLLPKEFTLSEIQQTYEAILRKGLDKRNFRKKILASGLIKPLAEKVARGAHRPATLYSFATTGYAYADMV